MKMYTGERTGKRRWHTACFYFSPGKMGILICNSFKLGGLESCLFAESEDVIQTLTLI